MNIKEISREGKKITITRNNEWFMSMIGDATADVESIKDELSSVINVRISDNRSVVIDGDVYADIVLRCVKCLESFHHVVNRQFSVSLEPYDQSLSMHHAITGTELDTEFYVNNEFDPGTVVLEQIMLSLPMYPLCKPDCKGLCKHCGINLNEHPGHECGKDKSEDNPFRKQIEKIKKTL